MKIRVTSTGRTFVANFEPETFEIISRKLEEFVPEKSKEPIKYPYRRSTRNLFERVGGKPNSGQEIYEQYLNLEVSSVPKSIAMKFPKINKNIISPIFVNNTEENEKMNEFMEPEALTIKKRTISSWSHIVTSMNYIKIQQKDRWGIQIEEEKPVKLREILYDNLHFTDEDKSFLYVEVELKFKPIHGKNSPDKKLNPAINTGSINFTAPLTGIHKTRLSDYVLQITTTHMPSHARKKIKPRLDMVIAKLDNYYLNPAVTLITYEQLRSYAARYVREEVKTYSGAAACSPRFIAPDLTSTPGGQNLQTSQMATSRPQAQQTPANANQQQSFTGMFGGITTDFKEKGKASTKTITERKLIFEELIKVSPPVVGKIILVKGLNQMILRINGIANDIHYEIPISYMQASRESNISLLFFEKENAWLGRRLFEIYKDNLIKQYDLMFGGNAGNLVAAINDNVPRLKLTLPK